jgi:UDP-N-acetylmuramoylalanine--D-glutamate ligase
VHIREFSGKNVCILGFGKEGQSILRALNAHATHCEITIADRNASLVAPPEKCWLQVGTGWLMNLEKFDVLIKSPGIPPSILHTHSSLLTNATQIFLDTVAEDRATVIGVTGSKGKSTTASLIFELLTAAGKNASLIGNIGNPALDYLERSQENAFFVLEMSSYQLMDVTRSPHIAVVTSFFPEHLDYHGSLEAYKEAKKHVTRFQTEEDLVFFLHDSPGAREIAEESAGKKIPFGPQDAPVAIGETKLLGVHNLSNIAAAWKVAQELGIPKETCLDVFRNFHGLPHRLQDLGVFHDITWVDDAISTTPESTIAALDALGSRVATVILGGQDRGNDFSELAKRIKGSSVRTVILFPGSGPRIRKVLEDAEATVTFHDADSMEDAVRIAQESTPDGMICLLSTASPSYGMFKNFEDKGDQFKQWIGTGNA